MEGSYIERIYQTKPNHRQRCAKWAIPFFIRTPPLPSPTPIKGSGFLTGRAFSVGVTLSAPLIF